LVAVSFILSDHRSIKTDLTRMERCKNPGKLLQAMDKNIFETLHSADLDFHNYRTTYSMHGIHPYGAKFPPQLPRWVINNLSKPGELIVDPFSGGGTTLVEGRLLKRSVAGGDVDPLAQRVSMAKAVPLDVDKLAEAARILRDNLLESRDLLDTHHGELLSAEVPPPELRINGYNVVIPNFPRRDYWFHPRVSVELALIHHLLCRLDSPELRRFLEVVLSSCIISKKSPVANVADLVHTRPHFQRKESLPPVIDIFLGRLSRAQGRMLDFARQVDHNTRTLWVGGDIRQGLALKDDSVHLVVTSPPYVNALDYPRAHRFALCWLGLSYEEYHEITYDHMGLQRAPIRRWQEMEGETIGIRDLDEYICQIAANDVKTASLIKRYLLDLRLSLIEIQRVMMRGRFAAIVIGSSTVHGLQVDSPSLIQKLAVAIGFQHIHTIMRKLDAEKRYLPFRSSGIDGGIRKEAVLIFKKN
jgi:hypothetical protein